MQQEERDINKLEHDLNNVILPPTQSFWETGREQKREDTKTLEMIEESLDWFLDFSLNKN